MHLQFYLPYSEVVIITSDVIKFWNKTISRSNRGEKWCRQSKAVSSCSGLYGWGL